MASTDQIVSEDASKPIKKAKRVIAFDFLRGGAIIGVLCFHLLNVTYDYQARFDYDYVPIPFYLLVIVLGFFGAMFPLFIIVSASVNTISMDKQWKKLTRAANNLPDDKLNKKAFKKIFMGQFTRGVILITLGYVSEAFLNGYLLNLIISKPGDNIQRILSALYHSQILVVIGYGVIFSAIIYLYLRMKKKETAQIIKILIIIGVLIIILRPILLELAKLIPDFYGLKAGTTDTYEFKNLADGWTERNMGLNILYFFLAPWVYGWFPFAPNIAASFFGTAIGIQLATGEIPKKFLNRIIQASALFFIAGIVVLFTLNERYLDGFLIPTAGSLMLMVILLYFIEVRGKGTKLAKKTVSFRRFGNLGLTIWCLQWMMVLILQFIQVMLNWVNNTNIAFIDGPIFQSELSGWHTLLLILIIIPIWHFILWAWEEIDFKGSLEWMTVKIMSRGKPGASERGSLSNVLYNVESVIEKGEEYYTRPHKILLFVIIAVYMVGNALVLLA
jgi:hypothetical protein